MGMLQGYGEMLHVQHVRHQFPCPEVFPRVSTFLCFAAHSFFSLVVFWSSLFLGLPLFRLPSSNCCSAFSAILLPVVSYVLRHNKQLMPNTDRGLNHKIAETFNVSEAPINTE